MAGFHIHIAIGKVYLKKHKIKDPNAFFKGIIAPDLGAKDLTHYTDINRDKNNLIDYLAKKVNLYAYLLKNNIDSEYQKGFFLHLITDYLFFNKFFAKDYLRKTNHDTFVKDLYYSYDINNRYLLEKYNLNNFLFQDIIEEAIKKSCAKYKNKNEKRTNILDNDDVDKFINEVANINLENYRKKIIENKGNI